ncbi:fungal specific transcription factor [Fusarium pseudocircinatum]|uniref:Fungal specific transcription factor n=1 Tax=Fusarium pseudocircinatum TaxID=56676 RepID=A0A8H5L9E3_9HYPO|nr:fungal specific transcription factor [Fusarium pseudocircinatum]
MSDESSHEADLCPTHNAADLSPPTGPPPHRRRDKKQLSCEFCRKRNLSCFFPSARAPRLTSRPAPRPQASQKPSLSVLENKVKSLEQMMISTLATIRHEPPDLDASSPSNSSGIPLRPHLAEAGTMRRGNQGTEYFGGIHWVAIMDGISEIKGHFEDLNVIQSPETYGQEVSDESRQRPLLLYSGTQPPPKERLISELPERNKVDRMVFHYFSEMSMMPLIALHPPTFLREYEQFWANPCHVSIHFIGLLYSILSISTIFSRKSEAPTSDTMSDSGYTAQYSEYAHQMVHCLKAGDYVRGGPYILETLINYTVLELMMTCPSPSVHSGIYATTGLMTQIAFRMGYHRDPCHFLQISCFEGEMRRRIWATIHILDTSMSVLSGSPRVIAEGSWDTKPPRNLHDGDLDPSCTTLPGSRPDSELTPVSCPLARYKLSLAVGWLIDANVFQGLILPSEKRQAEARLAETWNAIPDRFKFESLSNCLSESPAGVGQRIGLTTLYNKMYIMLHISHLLESPGSADDGDTPAEEDVEYQLHSRRKCIQAALQNVELLIIMETESRPGGALTVLRNKMSILAVHEALVATAVLSTFLYHFGTWPATNGETDSIDMAHIEATLRNCRDTWVRWSEWSPDARRAVELLDLVFQKLDGTMETVPMSEFSLALDGMSLNLS